LVGQKTKFLFNENINNIVRLVTIRHSVLTAEAAIVTNEIITVVKKRSECLDQ
jgi:hypothetical protein